MIGAVGPSNTVMPDASVGPASSGGVQRTGASSSEDPPPEIGPTPEETAEFEGLVGLLVLGIFSSMQQEEQITKSMFKISPWLL